MESEQYRVRVLEAGTYVIQEKHREMNNMYLIVGEKRALLFDSGFVDGDIKLKAEQLTNQPITVISSHSHYDHIGNHHKFDRIAMVDIPENRKQINEDGLFCTDSNITLKPPYHSFKVTKN
jgi:hydroxyacylglutathione hydrolase